MNKLLCIVGPTGTGKTERAIVESNKTPSIIVSADSRQVFRGMDIVTGKDHPKGITIYGIDIVEPDEPCSVAVWYDSVIRHIENAWEQGKRVIVVGGTGLYAKALTEGITTMQVPINQSLRDSLKTLSITELQTKLSTLSQEKLQSMNNSDQNNPRRLIRAIEVSADNSLHPLSTIHHPPSTTIIGLKHSDYSNYRSIVEKRVKQRIGQDAIGETERLLAQYNPTVQSMTAIGYRSILKYLHDDLTMDQMVEAWVADELAYAKRQLTWFAKIKSIQWDYIDNKNYANSEN